MRHDVKTHRRKTRGRVTGEELIEAIGSIYEAALDISQWQAAIGRIAHALDAHRAQLFAPEMRVGRELWVAHNIDAAMMPGYAEYYRHKDLWVLRSFDRLRDPGATSFDTMEVTEAEYLRSEFWNDFTRPIDVFRAACVTIDTSGPSPRDRTYLAVYRPRRSEAFDQQTLAFLRTIQPHVQRSLKLSLLLSSATSERSMFHAMLGAVSTPMLACSANTEIQYANPSAEALLRKNDGLGTDGRRLVAATPGHTNQLVRAIGKVAGAASPDGTQTGQTLQVPQRSSGRPLTVTVAPLPRNDDRLLGMQRAVALVVVHVPRQLHETELAILREAHALTAAELRVVCSMLDGGGLPQVAARLGIGHSTARTHLKHIFAKTHTRRQAELVELVHRLVH